MYSVIMIHSYISNLIAVIVWSHVDLPLASCQIAPSTKDEHQGSLGKEVKEMMGNNSAHVQLPYLWQLLNGSPCALGAHQYRPEKQENRGENFGLAKKKIHQQLPGHVCEV